MDSEVLLERLTSDRDFVYLAHLELPGGLMLHTDGVRQHPDGGLPRQPDDPGTIGAPERLGDHIAKIIVGLVVAAVAAFIAWMKLG
mgnify:CR=1 FL=1